MKFCVGSFQDPGEMTVRSGLTHVDLRARRVRNEDNLLTRWSSEFLGHIRAGDGLSAGVSGESDKSGEQQQSGHHAQEFTTLGGACAGRQDDRDRRFLCLAPTFAIACNS
jgi:hypothetical protein